MDRGACHVETCGGQRSKLGNFFNCSPPYLLRWCLSLNLTVSDWLASKPL